MGDTEVFFERFASPRRVKRSEMEIKMENLRELFLSALNENLVQMVLSNTRDSGRAVKAKIRPVYLKDDLKFQETVYRGTQVFHTNFDAEELAEKLAGYMENLFRQAEIKGLDESATVLVSKKGTVTIKGKRATSRSRTSRRKSAICPTTAPNSTFCRRVHLLIS